MAIIGGGRSPRRSLSLRGVVDVYIRAGKLVARQWPAKRGKTKSSYVQGLRDRMAAVTAHTKALRHWEVLPIREALKRWRGKSTGFRAGALIRERDWLTRVAYGRMWAIEMPDGTIIWPEALAMDISDALDVQSPRPGSLMVRTTETWKPTYQCQAGWIFTLTPDGVFPWACTPAARATGEEAVGVYAE